MANNNIKTNSIATLIAIRAAESAGYLTVGSKANFKDQLVGKRNGQTYRFVTKDTGEAKQGLSISDNDDVNIVEREVALSLDPWHVAVKTDAIESVTDLDLDAEIAEPNGQKLINAIVKNQIGKDFGKAGAGFVGSGFAPLSQASAYLAAITNEELYGFCDPNVEAILTSNGQQFVPVNAPDMYAKGLLGKFHGAEYRAQRFMPSVVISDVVSKALNAASVTSFANVVDGEATVVLGFAATSAASTIKKGTPIWIEGVYGTDTVGDMASNEKVWVVLNDVNVASGATSATIKVCGVQLDNSTREICDADGSNMTAAKFASRKVSAPEAGRYFMGIVRANGSYEFETLDKIEAAGADYQKETVNGVTVHMNKLIDLKSMDNWTRFDTITLAGVIEPRCVAYFWVK